MCTDCLKIISLLFKPIAKQIFYIILTNIFVDTTCKHTNDDLNHLISPTTFSIIVVEEDK